MAGEYSRELSAKVFAGQCRLIELGFRQGGPAGYGLRRVLIDQHGIMKSELQRGGTQESADGSCHSDAWARERNPDCQSYLQLVRR
jgi:hypothetical protein